MKTKFRKGQKVVCVHYKDKPVVIVDSVDVRYDQLWVRNTVTKPRVSDYWWGPLSWFKPVCKKIHPIKKPRGPRGLVDEGSLCDNGIPGCSCNQSASIAQ